MVLEPAGTRRPDLSRRQFLTRVAGGTLVALTIPDLLAACTNAGQSSTSSLSGSPGGASTATLRVGWSSEPDTMNPLTSKRRRRGSPGTRSEEHTSELQSHSDLVCRLL